MANMTWTLFGGDAARQNAEDLAKERGGKVFVLGNIEAPFDRYGLDPWGYGGPEWDRVRYSHVTVYPREDA